MVYIIYPTIKEKNLGIIYLKISILIYSHFFSALSTKEYQRSNLDALRIIMGDIEI